ncbi:uncharacterized protein B0P05DRAFT_555548 [Gilbertella persicaria]|uniref:uncharacterized protein n=1 Tax=Gilbertella persicaria TaxID=101096 RepID=UPI00221F2D57|nr:uncharacterized protein B0P05DRAFT_555548 [Gilbertella persicaria]KAI8063350.1 hypothetical protein B0P05DRAFT_555548 [Gilbertella persicaria]
MLFILILSCHRQSDKREQTSLSYSVWTNIDFGFKLTSKATLSTGCHSIVALGNV